MNNSLIEKWFVVQIKPNSYQKAKRNLEQQGCVTFIPTVEFTKRKSDKFSSHFNYLFPGYIFVSFNPFLLKSSKINNTLGVLRLLTFNGKPGEIPVELISELKSRCNFEDKFL